MPALQFEASSKVIPRIQGILFHSWGFSKAFLPPGSLALSPQWAVWGNRFELLAYFQLLSSPSWVGERGSGGTSLLPLSSGGGGTAAGLPAYPEGAEQMAE